MDFVKDIVRYFLFAEVGRVSGTEVLKFHVPQEDRDAVFFTITLDKDDNFAVFSGGLDGGSQLFFMEHGPVLGKGPLVEKFLAPLTRNPRFTDVLDGTVRDMTVRELKTVLFETSITDLRRKYRAYLPEAIAAFHNETSASEMFRLPEEAPLTEDTLLLDIPPSPREPLAVFVTPPPVHVSEDTSESSSAVSSAAQNHHQERAAETETETENSSYSLDDDDDAPGIHSDVTQENFSLWFAEDTGTPKERQDASPLLSPAPLVAPDISSMTPAVIIDDVNVGGPEKEKESQETPSPSILPFRDDITPSEADRFRPPPSRKTSVYDLDVSQFPEIFKSSTPSLLSGAPLSGPAAIVDDVDEL